MKVRKLCRSDYLIEKNDFLLNMAEKLGGGAGPEKALRVTRKLLSAFMNSRLPEYAVAITGFP